MIFYSKIIKYYNTSCVYIRYVHVYFFWVWVLNYQFLFAVIKNNDIQLVRADIFSDVETILVCKIVLVSQMTTKAIVCLTVCMQHAQQIWLVCNATIPAFNMEHTTAHKWIKQDASVSRKHYIANRYCYIDVV